ncbi:MAG: hypothetical protein ACK5MA_05460 [Parachlamydiaceae bacterium]
MTKIDSAYNLFFHPLSGPRKVRAAGKLLASIAIFISTLGTLHLAVGCIKKYRVKHLNAPAAKTSWGNVEELHHNPNVIRPAEGFSGDEAAVPNSLLEAIKGNCPLGPMSNPEGHALIWVASHWVLVRRNPIYTNYSYLWDEDVARHRASELDYEVPTQDEMRAYLSAQPELDFTRPHSDARIGHITWGAFCEGEKFIASHDHRSVWDRAPPRGFGLLLGVKRA